MSMKFEHSIQDGHPQLALMVIARLHGRAHRAKSQDKEESLPDPWYLNFARKQTCLFPSSMRVLTKNARSAKRHTVMVSPWFG